MTRDWLALIELSALFIALFAMAEVLYHLSGMKAEYTRKIVHVGTGILTLLFPLCLHHLWQVVVICSAFLLLLTGSLRLGLLKSINAVSRKTSGSLLYPVIVILVFAFYQFMQLSPLLFHKLLYFYLPVLLMAVCDPIAALAGGWYKKRRSHLQGKTMAGSFCFLISAFLLSVILFSVFNIHTGYIQVTIYAIVIAFTAMLAERISNKGWDNFTIPFAVMVCLYAIELIKR